MGMHEYNSDFECTAAQYHSNVSSLWRALGVTGVQEKSVFDLAAEAIKKNKQTPTKRELFAAMAMQGLLAYPLGNQSVGVIATVAVKAADALIAELSKEVQGD